MRQILLIMIGTSMLLHANFSRDSSGIVSDSITGLAWQDDYSDNAGEIKEATWQDALIYCEELNLGGKNDWRLPNIRALGSIVDDAKFDPAINSIFINVASYFYWSSTMVLSDFSYARNVYFHSGSNGLGAKRFETRIRCVRGGHEEESESIVPSQSAEISTPIAGTEVQWVKPSQSVCESNGGTYYSYENKTACQANWENAKTICSASGDVLPTIETLRAVVTDCGGILSIWGGDDYENNASENRANESYQSCYKERGFTSFHYWSSTTYASSSSHAWRIGFSYGYLYYYNKLLYNNVNCVRVGQ